MDTTVDRGTGEPHTAEDRAVELWGRVINGFEMTNSRIHDAIDREFSLTAAEAQVLLNLHRQPGQRAPMARLAQAASFSTGGFTKLADKLTQRGYVRRAACSDDRRVTFLEFTPEGLDVAGRLTARTARTNHQVFIDVLGEQRATLLAEAMTELFRANAPAED